MFDWLISQLSTIVVLLVLAAVVAAIISSMARDRRKGISSCGGSCGACPMHDRCHSMSQKHTQKET